MLSQTGGTLGAITDLGNYTDAKHYRLPEPAGARVVYNLLTLAAGGTPSSAGVHVVPSVQRHVSSASRRHRGRARPRGPDARPGRDVGARRVHVSSAAAIARRCSRRWPRGSASIITAAAPFAAPPSGWCSWYCFGPKVTAQAGARQPRRDRARHPRPSLHPDRRWLSAGDGRLARDRQRVRRRGADGARSRSASAASSPRSGWRRSSPKQDSQSVQAASRLVRQGRRRPAAARRSRHVRRLAARSVVRARRHASRGAGASRARVHDDARRVGLHVFQARRQLLGRDSRRSLPRSARDAHRGVSARHGGGAARQRATRSSSAAIIRSGRRSA